MDLGPSSKKAQSVGLQRIIYLKHVNVSMEFNLMSQKQCISYFKCLIHSEDGRTNDVMQIRDLFIWQMCMCDMCVCVCVNERRVDYILLCIPMTFPQIVILSKSNIEKTQKSIVNWICDMCYQMDFHSTEFVRTYVYETQEMTIFEPTKINKVQCFIKYIHRRHFL